MWNKRLIFSSFSFILSLSLMGCGISRFDESGSVKTDYTSISSNINEIEKEKEEVKVEEKNNDSLFEFEPFLVAENDIFRLTFDSLELEEVINREGYYFPTINYTLENKMDDSKLVYSFGGVFIDSVYASGVSGTLEPSEVMEYFIDINSEEFLYKDGEFIDVDFTHLEIPIYVCRYGDTNSVYTDTIHIYPFGESKATVYNRELNDNEIILIDNEYLRLVLLNYYNETEKYSNDWHTFRFYIENKSEKKLNIDSENQVLNGVSYDDEVMFIHDILSDGRKYFMTYYIREDDVGDIEIETFSSDIVVHETSAGGYDGDLLFKERIDIELE